MYLVLILFNFLIVYLIVDSIRGYYEFKHEIIVTSLILLIAFNSNLIFRAYDSYLGIALEGVILFFFAMAEYKMKKLAE